jgi:PAS domain S-box-containing protein
MKTPSKAGFVRPQAGRKDGIVRASMPGADPTSISPADLSWIFNCLPISVRVEDFSAIKERLDALKRAGIKDFRGHFKRHPDEIISMAERVRIVAVNDATLRLYEAVTRRDLGRGLSLIFDKASYDVFREKILALAEGQMIFAGEAMTRTLKGNLRQVLLDLIVVPSSRESLSRVFVFVTDITSLKASQKDVQECEAKYRAIVECAPDALIVTDANTGIVLESNRMAERLFGITADMMTGMRYAELFLSERPERPGTASRNRSTEERWKSDEVIIHRESGERIPVHSACCVKNIGGRRFVLTVLRSRDLEEPGKPLPGSLESKAENGAAIDRISRRERDVIRLIAAGFANREIAKKLFISIKTVGTHRARIMEKLGVHKAADVVRFAIRSGLSPYPPDKG